MRKMALFIILLLTTCVHARAGLFHVEEISRHQEFSYGLRVKDDIYFLSSLHRYNEPNWLGRIPDGGQAKTVSYKLALFKVDPELKRLSRVDVLSLEKPYGTNIKGARLLFKKQEIVLSYRCSNHLEDKFDNQCFYRCDLGKSNCFAIKDEKKVKQTASEFKGYWPIYRDRLIPISQLRRKYLNNFNESDWLF